MPTLLSEQVARMAQTTTETFTAPRRVTLPMVMLIALIAGAMSWATTYALLNQQVADTAREVARLDKDLQPRVRSLEDDNRDQKIILTVLQATTAATQGSLDGSRKDLNERLSSIQIQLATLATQVNGMLAASGVRLPGEQHQAGKP